MVEINSKKWAIQFVEATIIPWLTDRKTLIEVGKKLQQVYYLAYSKSVYSKCNNPRSHEKLISIGRRIRYLFDNELKNVFKRAKIDWKPFIIKNNNMSFSLTDSLLMHEGIGQEVANLYDVPDFVWTSKKPHIPLYKYSSINEEINMIYDNPKQYTQNKLDILDVKICQERISPEEYSRQRKILLKPRKKSSK